MGGRGSGNRDHWWRPVAKTTTDECLDIDVNYLSRAGILKAGVCQPCTLTWKVSGTGKEIGSVGIEVFTLDRCDPWVRVSFTKTPTGERVSYAVGLCTTRPNWGGRRWWFKCPVPNLAGTCGRRVGKLFLPPGQRYFGCRHCHGLTYESCQDSHRLDSSFRSVARSTGMDFETVKQLLTRPDFGFRSLRI